MPKIGEVALANQPPAASGWPSYSPGDVPGTGQLPPPLAKIRPGRIWYLPALASLVGGVLWLVLAVVSVINQVNGLQRVPMPQGGQVNLPHSGGYVIYYEGPGALSGNIGAFTVHVAPASAGAAVAPRLTTYGAGVTYSIGSHHGRAVLNLQVTHPGKFLVRSTGSPNSATAAPAGSDLAIGPSVAGDILKILLPSLGLMILGFVATLLIFILRIVQRSRQRRPAWGSG